MTAARKCYTKESKLNAISPVLDRDYTRKGATASLEIDARRVWCHWLTN